MATFFAVVGCVAVAASALGLLWFANHVAVPAIEGWHARRRGGITRAAELRARGLFYEKLDAWQRRSWSIRRRFTVTARSGTRYVISHYRPYNVRTNDAVFCLQVLGQSPSFDKLLAQKLLLESDESYFLALANVHTYSDRRREAIATARADCRARGLVSSG